MKRQKTECKLTIRTLSAKTWSYTYTDDNQLKEVVNPDSETTLHEYLTDGRTKKITLRKSGVSNGPTRELFYQDTDNSHGYVSAKCKFLRKTLDKKSGGAVIDSFSYTTDKTGRNLGREMEDDKYTFFGLDPLGNTAAETMWDSKTGTSRQYQVLAAFDPNGNRLSKFEDGTLEQYTYGDNDEILTAGSDSFTFDHFLNMKTKTSGGNTTTYGWDFESNLKSIDYPSTANDDSHQYDGQSRRMRSKLNGASEWTHFIWDEVSGTLLAEYTLISGTYLIKSVNTWGLGLISTNRESTKRYFHFDGLGNSIALTDGSEDVTDTYGYTTSGTSVTSEDSGTSVNPFRWMGNSGAYDDGARGSAGTLISVRGIAYSSDLKLALIQASILFTEVVLIQRQRQQQIPPFEIPPWDPFPTPGTDPISSICNDSYLSHIQGCTRLLLTCRGLGFPAKYCESVFDQCVFNAEAMRLACIVGLCQIIPCPGGGLIGPIGPARKRRKPFSVTV